MCSMPAGRLADGNAGKAPEKQESAARAAAGGFTLSIVDLARLGRTLPAVMGA